MIRIYSHGYDEKDYRILRFALTAGITEMKKLMVCTGYCDSCYCGKVCRSLQSAINYADKKGRWEEK